MKMMSNQKVSVVREKLAACMRCGVCDKLMRDATTISECMHHFCRKCIYKKITVEEVDDCPVCGVNLGADPLEKLRPDHNLRELRAKIFETKKLGELSTNVGPEPEALNESHAKRKERSLSSLGANVAKQKSEPFPSGKRIKHQKRKPRYSQPSRHLEKLNVKNKNNILNDLQEQLSSSEEKHKLLHGSSDENSGNEWPIVKKTTDKADSDAKLPHTSDDIWNPLNFLIEVANQTKPAMSEIPKPLDDEVQIQKTRMKDYNRKTNIDESLQVTNQKRSRKVHSKKTPEIPIRIIPSPSVTEDYSSKERKSGPVWLQLLASENQGTDMQLPHIPIRYLRIKDGSMTVSYVRKYIIQKLNIDNEDEIEIACMGQPLSPSMHLRDVVTSWLRATGTPTKITVTIGSSAKDFIMVLTYTRKAPSPPPPTSSLSLLHL